MNNQSRMDLTRRGMPAVAVTRRSSASASASASTPSRLTPTIMVDHRREGRPDAPTAPHGAASCDVRGPTLDPTQTCTWPLAEDVVLPSVDGPTSPACTPAPTLTPATTTPPRETLTFAEALALVGVSRNTLYRLAAEGRIPGAQKIGKTWRFHQATLLDFLARPELYRQRRRR